MSLAFLLRILKARWSALAMALFLTLTIAVAVSLVLPKQYVATADLVIDVSGQDPVRGNPFPAYLLPDYLATQADIIQSHRVAEKVVDRIGLADDPQLQALLFGTSKMDWIARELRWLLGGEAEKSSPTGESSQQAAIARALVRQLKVEMAPEGSIISIAFSAPDPQAAAYVANAFAQAYLTASVELRAAPARQVSEWYVGQLAGLRQQLEQAQRAHTEYQRVHGLVGVDKHLDLELVRLADLSSKLLDAESERVALATRARQLRNDGLTLAEVINDPVIQELRGRLAQAQARLTEMTETVGENHPQYREARVEVEALRRRLDGEIAMTSSMIASSAHLSLSREKELRTRVEEQRQRVLALREQRDRLSLLAREVEHAERAYDAALERASQAQLEGQLLTQANVSLLSSAVPPQQPAFPKWRLNLAAGFLLGMTLGMTAIFRLEQVDRKVRGAADLERMLGLPVLARLPVSLRSLPRLMTGGR